MRGNAVLGTIAYRLQRWLILAPYLLSLVATVRYDAVKQQTGYFWQIDSAHLNLNFSMSGDRSRNCIATFSPHGSGTPMHLRPLSGFGDPECDSSYELIKSATDFIKKVRGEDFDFILWTGDSAPHGSQAPVQYLNKMTSILKEKFPYSSIYPVLGDRDFSPPGQARPEGEPMYEEAAKQWNTWLPPKAVKTLEHGGYYKIDLAGRKLQLIALNTALYLDWNLATRGSYTSYSYDPAGQWQWLDASLQKAKDEHKSVIIFGHTPPGVWEAGWRTGPGRHWFQHYANARYLNLVTKYQKTIVGQYFGHQNTDTFRIFYDPKTHLPSNWALIAPGLSPRSLLEGVRQPVTSNPALRLYKYSVYDGKVLDYTQFSLSLERSAKEPQQRAIWEPQYNFSSLYETEAITADSLDQVYREMRKEGSLKLNGYLKSNTAGSPSPCPAACRKVHLCAIRNVDITFFNKCVSQASGYESVRPFSPILIITLLLLLTSR